MLPRFVFARQVNVVAFSSSAQTPDAPDTSNSTCYSHQLVTLTLQNKDHLTKFIETLQTDADTSYIPAFTTAFQLFKQTPVKEEKRGYSSISVQKNSKIGYAWEHLRGFLKPPWSNTRLRQLLFKRKRPSCTCCCTHVRHAMKQHWFVTAINCYQQ